MSLKKQFIRAGDCLARICLASSALCMVALMLLTVVEVIGRYAFNAPIFGRQDIAQVLLALCIFLAFPASVLKGEQICVDLLDGFFSKTSAFYRDVLIGIISSIAILTMGYWLYLRAERAYDRGIASELLFLPKYPLIYAIAFIVFVTGFVLAVQTITTVFKGPKK